MRKGWLACCALAGVVASVQADVTVTAKVLDPRFGDTVTVSPQQETYAEGTTVTLTGTLAGETVYKRWYGLPEDAVIDTTGLTAENTGVVTATFTVGTNALDVTFHSAPIWYYVKDAPCGYVTNTVVTAEDGTETMGTEFVAFGEKGIISNAVWRLNTRVRSTTDRWLTFGIEWEQKISIGRAYTGYGSGVLDLSGPIRTLPDAEGASEEWTINYPASAQWNGYYQHLGNNGSEVAVNGYPTVFVAPETTERLPYRMMYPALSDRLTNVVIISSNLLSIGSQAFTGAKLSKLVLKVPSLTALSGTGLAVNSHSASDFELDSVRAFGSLMASWNQDLSGTLRLPKVVKMEKEAISQYSFCSLELGTAYTPEDKVSLAIDTYFTSKTLR